MRFKFWSDTGYTLFMEAAGDVGLPLVGNPVTLTVAFTDWPDADARALIADYGGTEIIV